MNIRKFKINWQAGEITTIIALGTMAFILVTTIASTFISKKPQTTSTKAAGSNCCIKDTSCNANGCTGGTRRWRYYSNATCPAGSQYTTCSLSSGSSCMFDSSCSNSGAGTGGGGSSSCGGYDQTQSQCYQKCAGNCEKCPTDSTKYKCVESLNSSCSGFPYTSSGQCKSSCDVAGCESCTSGGVTKYRCKNTSSGGNLSPISTSGGSTNNVSCTPHSCLEISCATKTGYWCLTGGKYYSCSSMTKGSCSQTIYSANDYCGCYSGVSPAAGECCTISDLCGSAGCKDNEKYVKKYPSVKDCTGAYTKCPSGVNWHTATEGCAATSSCGGGSGGTTSGCTLTGQSCPSGYSGTYNSKKSGTGTTASYTYYPANSDCSGNGSTSIATACSQNKPSPTPTGWICGSSGCVTARPKPSDNISDTPIPNLSLTPANNSEQVCKDIFGSASYCSYTLSGGCNFDSETETTCGINSLGVSKHCCIPESIFSLNKCYMNNTYYSVGDAVCINNNSYKVCQNNNVVEVFGGKSEWSQPIDCLNCFSQTKGKVTCNNEKTDKCSYNNNNYSANTQLCDSTNSYIQCLSTGVWSSSISCPQCKITGQKATCEKQSNVTCQQATGNNNSYCDKLGGCLSGYEIFHNNVGNPVGCQEGIIPGRCCVPENNGSATNLTQQAFTSTTQQITVTEGAIGQLINIPGFGLSFLENL